MAEDEPDAVSQVSERMATGQGRASRFTQPGQEEYGAARQHRGYGERRRGAHPPDERAGQCRPGGVRDRAGQLDACVRRGQRVGRHQRGHERRRGHAVGDGAGRADEAEHREQRQRQQPELRERQHPDERRHAQELCEDHDARARGAIRQHARGDGEQQERQRLRRLEPARLAGAGTEGEHRHDRGGRQADLLGRLCREVRPCETSERRRKTCRGRRERRCRACNGDHACTVRGSA